MTRLRVEVARALDVAKPLAQEVINAVDAQ